MNKKFAIIFAVVVMGFALARGDIDDERSHPPRPKSNGSSLPRLPGIPPYFPNVPPYNPGPQNPIWTHRFRRDVPNSLN